MAEKTCATCVHDKERDSSGCPHMGCLANGMRDYKEAEGFGDLKPVKATRAVREREKKEKEEKGGLFTLSKFWIPVNAFKGKKGIIYESRYTGKRIFLKHVNRKQHFMRKYKSWAINEDILADLVKAKVEQIYIEVKNEGLFMTTIENFQEKSFIDEYPPHGMQAFLEETFWEKVE